MPFRLVQFLAVILTALAMVPVGAHLFELPNKMPLGRDEYFTVQAIYRGWAVLGGVLIAAIAADLLLALMLRHRRPAFWLAVLGFLLMAATLAIFFGWTYPANQATANWTVVPPDWQDLRRHWEYSHATNALLTFVALCSVTLSVGSAGDDR